MIVVDTSVYIARVRHQEHPAVDELERLHRDMQRFLVPLPVVQEVLQGTVKGWLQARRYFESHEILWSDDPLRSTVAAARIAVDLRSKNLRVESTLDLLIAQLSIEHRGTLLFVDGDYQTIQRVRPKLRLWAPEPSVPSTLRHR